MFKKITLVGLGLLGGSLAKAIKEKFPKTEVEAVSRNQESLQLALKEGVINKGMNDLSELASDVDLIILCSPVQVIEEHLRQLKQLKQDKVLVSDIGSTKKAVVRTAESEQLRFVGGHPIAGSEKSGFCFASKDMFQGRRCILTPTAQTNRDDLAALDEFWVSLGSEVCYLSPEQHDETMAFVSHLPHIVSSNLVNTVHKEHLELIGQGFLDTTRLAAGSAEMWRDICLSNRESIIQAVAMFQTELEKLKKRVQEADQAGILEWFEKAQKTRSLWS